MCGRCSSQSLVAPTVALSVTLGVILSKRAPVGTALTIAHQQRPQAAWYGQTVHELGQSVNVACTPSIEWAGILERKEYTPQCENRRFSEQGERAPER